MMYMEHKAKQGTDETCYETKVTAVIITFDRKQQSIT